MTRSAFFIILHILPVYLISQDSTVKNPLSFSGFADVYYQYDFNKPGDGNRPDFIYSHNRHNEFTLNLGYVKATYTTRQIRANLALAAGSYMNANYAEEPGVLKNIFEARLGVKLSKRKNIWLDAGILPSHIGFESAASKESWTLTRSIMAENTPYFEGGAKITFTTDDGKWLLSGMALNGWQRITRVNGNSLMCWGTQLQYKPSDKVWLNYSSFVGTDKPDSARLLRYFHNIYAIFFITEKIGFTLGFDIGSEEKIRPARGHNTWYSPVGILKYCITDKWTIAGRVEHYNDKKGVIITTTAPNGFQTAGYSMNIDYAPVKNVLLRGEGRVLKSKDPFFIKDNSLVKKDIFMTASIAVSF